DQLPSAWRQKLPLSQSQKELSSRRQQGTQAFTLKLPFVWRPELRSENLKPNGHQNHPFRESSSDANDAHNHHRSLAVCVASKDASLYPVPTPTLVAAAVPRLAPPIHFLPEETSMAALRLPPSPPAHWLTGHLPEFRRDMLGFFTRCAREQGDLVAIRLGPRRVHLASHPDFVEQVLVTENKKFGKSYVFELLRPMLGNGLLNSEGEFWLRQRRLMQPAFSRNNVNSFAGTIVSHTQRLL